MSASSFLFPVFAGAFFFICAPHSAGAEPPVSTLPQPADRQVTFEKDIKPILERSCAQCHGAVRPKGRFRVDSLAALLKGGDSGESAILPGKSAQSQLVRFVADAVKEMEMPPLEKRQKFPALNQTEIGLIRAWIDQGAKWPDGVKVLAPASIAAELPDIQSDPASSTSHPIFAMIRWGDFGGISKALADPSVLMERDQNGNTPLIQAAFYLNAKQLGFFLQNGADINATNKSGATALMKAVWDLDKTRLLVRRGANVNAVSSQGSTPLIIASSAYGMAGVVKELVAAGAGVNAANAAGLNPVFAASEAGDVEMLKVLLDHHGDPNSKSKIPESNSDVSALMIAAQTGHLDCVKLLLERGADPNLMGMRCISPRSPSGAKSCASCWIAASMSMRPAGGSSVFVRTPA